MLEACDHAKSPIRPKPIQDNDRPKGSFDQKVSDPNRAATRPYSMSAPCSTRYRHCTDRTWDWCFSEAVGLERCCWTPDLPPIRLKGNDVIKYLLVFLVIAAVIQELGKTKDKEEVFSQCRQDAREQVLHGSSDALKRQIVNNMIVDIVSKKMDGENIVIHVAGPKPSAGSGRCPSLTEIRCKKVGEKINVIESSDEGYIPC